MCAVDDHHSNYGKPVERNSHWFMICVFGFDLTRINDVQSLAEEMEEDLQYDRPGSIGSRRQVNCLAS